MIDTIICFLRHLKAKTWAQTSSCFVHPNYPKLLQDEKDFEKLIKYTVYLGNKIVLHGYQQEIGEFVSLININGYYDNPQTSATHN
jgi:gamma-tubulin complex component 6